ncbi:MAG TPA: hypothetical protein VEU76_05550 [Candidatus Udaeobacter sp.]|nr:hypothetical protein [Candidatus Udaeobacter sp.]
MSYRAVRAIGVISGSAVMMALAGLIHLGVPQLHVPRPVGLASTPAPSISYVTLRRDPSCPVGYGHVVQQWHPSSDSPEYIVVVPIQRSAVNQSAAWVAAGDSAASPVPADFSVTGRSICP